ncbi:hypothetical protein [Kitasatospora sp. HPMI-4]|uniref:hypothetical protein n=1 Tax=Kitasatospora sp. HPMI-4 TaxID=3448443 RepID=UPI003F197607
MDNVDMLVDQIADLAGQAREAESADARVALLAQAVGLAWNPLMRIELLMLLADAAGRAAHEAADSALQGKGMPEKRPATWSQIAEAATLTKDTAFRQFHGGEALSWSPATRGVRQATRRGEGGA